MTKKAIKALVLLVPFLLLSTCEDPVSVLVSVTSVSINGGDLSLKQGDTVTLTATVQPGDANKKVTWSSSNPQAVYIRPQSGELTANAPGTAVITATARDGSGKKGSITVTVRGIVPVQTVSINGGDLTLKMGKTANLSATVLPADASDKGVVWSSSNSDVRIGEDGLLTAVSIGGAVITATAQDGSGVSGSINVTVTDQEPAPVESVSITGGNLSLKTGDIVQLAVNVFPAGAGNQNVYWESSDTSVASVTENGELTVHAPGTAVITAMAQDGSGVSNSITVSVSDSPVAAETLVTSVTINERDMTLKRGHTVDLSVTVLPDEAANKSVSWSSGNSFVASVTENGELTAVEVGITVITATARDGSGVSGSITVTVTENLILVTSVSINGGNVTLKMGQTVNLSVTTLPENASNKNVSWSSGAPDKAIVSSSGNSSGLVTAVAKGSAVITATAQDGSGVSSSVTVTVTDADPIPAASVTISGKLDIKPGENTTLRADVFPANAGNKNVSWSSDAPHIASVIESGEVTGIAAGSAVITATAQDGSGVKGTATVTVTPVMVSSVAVDGGDFQLTVGGAKALTVTVLPENATNKTITWSSSAAGVASVDETTGEVTAVAKGSAVITVVAKDGSGKTNTVTVTVNPVPVNSVAVDGGNFSLSIGNEKTLTASVLPDNAVNKTVTWSSDNQSVATVTENGGLVKAVAEGTAVITATAQDGSNVTGTAIVTVNSVKASNISVDGGDFQLTVGDVKNLTVTVTPENTTNKTVTWSSGAPGIAAVNAVTGAVTAVTTGTATITATANDGSGVKGVAVVTVTPVMVNSVVINGGDLTLKMGKTANLSVTVLPDNAVNKTVTWSSGAPGIATVNADGQVAAVAKGTAVITATAKDGSGKSGGITVTITDADPILADSVAINGGNFSLTVGENVTLSATVLPENTGNKAVTWSSGAPSVATVNAATGQVTAIAVGTAAITATANDGSGKVATVDVTVKPVLVNNVTVDGGNFSLIIGNEKTLTASISPDNAGNKNVKWSSSNPSVATVTENGGLVKAVAVGTAVITATAQDGSNKTGTATVTVTPILVTGIQIGNDFSLTVGGSQSLTAAITPNDATNKGVNWSSSDTTKATVDSTGNVTAVAVGASVITATAKDDSGVTRSVTVTVNAVKVDSVSIVGGDFSLIIGNEKTLTASISPDNAGNKTVKWSSSNSSVATVTENGGLVKAVTVGTVAITAAAQDGSGKTNTVTVTVNPVLVNSVAIGGGNFQLIIGDTKTLTVTVLPDNATNKTVTWSSGTPGVATVDTNGKVTAVAAGNSVITATAKDDSGVKGTVTVEVKLVPVSNVAVNGGDFSLIIGNEKTLTVSISPDNAGNKNVKWSSSNQSVATVTENGGLVKAVAVGTAVITAAAQDGSGKTGTVSVNVTKPVSTITIDGGDFTLLTGTVGNTKKLSVNVLPTDAANKDVTWSSSDPTKATVSAEGLVTAAAVGTSTITATAVDGSGKTGTAIVTVNKPVSSVVINESAFTLLTGSVGNTKQLTVNVLPDDAGNKAVTWKSGDTNRATVNANGLVTSGAQTGTVTITATAADGSGKTGTVTVTVVKPVSGITIDSGDFTLLTGTVGNTKKLTANVTPTDAGNRNITWSSSDATKATVSTDGLVTAVAVGTSTITATAQDGSGKTGTVTVTVVKPVSAITIDGGDFTLLTGTVGNTKKLTANVTPTDAGNRNITWSSSDTAKATVSTDGLVTAVAVGTSTITATAQDGSGKTGTVTVTVKVPVASIDIGGNFNLIRTGTKQLTAAVLPDNAGDKTVTWSSSYNRVTVSANGLVTVANNAVIGQTATITATANDGSGKTGTAVVTVATAVTGIDIGGNFNLIRNGTKQLTAAVTPTGATDKTVTWSSSNTAMATVDATGKVTIPANATIGQTATITATANDGSGMTGTAVVTVATAVAGIDIGGNFNLIRNGTKQLTAAVTPAGATDKTVTWSSSDTARATVDATGKVTITNNATIGGTATITATANDGSGVTGTAVVTVATAVTGIDIGGNFNLIRNGTKQLTAAVTPTGATDKTVTWSSSDTGKATVSTGGLVTAVAVGTSTITATANDGSGVTGTAIVTVNVAVTSIDIGGNFNLIINGTKQLTAAVLPDNAGDKTVTWSSSYNRVTVTNGLVTVANNAAIGQTATITATANDGSGVTGTAVVTVARAVTSIGIGGDFNLRRGGTKQLSLSVLPDNATDKTVTWSSSNTASATVTANGLVTATQTNGTATITAKANDGSNITGTAIVTVAQAVTSIAIGSDFSLTVGGSQTLTKTVNPSTACQTVTWSSSAAGVATVDATGKVTAVAAGTAVITATAQDGSDIAKSVTVTVNAAVTSVAINEPAFSLPTGDTKALTVTVLPDNANKAVTWSTSAAGIASVNATTGVVTAVAAGTATITATSQADSSKKGTVTVTVIATAIPFTWTFQDQIPGWTSSTTTNMTTDSVYLNGMTLLGSQRSTRWRSTQAVPTGSGGNAFSIGCVEPQGATAAGSYFLKINSVQGPFRITLNYTDNGNNGGRTADIYINGAKVKSGEGTSATNGANTPITVDYDYTGTDKVTVQLGCSASIRIYDVILIPYVSVTGVDIDGGNFSLIQGGAKQLTATVSPANATNQKVTWTTSNSARAAVDAATGLVTVPSGATPGNTANITATTEDGGKTKQITVTVLRAVTGITIDGGDFSLFTGNTGNTKTLTATVTPNDANNTGVNWSSSATGVATVDSTGKVTAVAAGTAVITATAQDGSGVTKTVTVTVTIPVTSIAIGNNFTLIAGNSQTLTATITPNNATNKGVNWSSASIGVATVDADGKVTAVAAGTAVITATAKDGSGVTRTVTVTVNPATVAVTSVTINEGSSIPLKAGGTKQLTVTVEPSNATDKTVTWTTSNANRAAVDANGKVTIPSNATAGTATITATSQSNTGVKGTTTVTVTVLPAAEVPYAWTFQDNVTGWTSGTAATGDADYLNNMTLFGSHTQNGINWNKTQNAPGGGFTKGSIQTQGTTATGKYLLEIYNVPGPFRLTLNYSGNAANQTGRYPIIYINGTEVKTGDSIDGQEPITVSYDHTGTTAATIQLRSVQSIRIFDVILEPYIPVTGVSINGGNFTLATGSSQALTATVTPTNATNKKVTWSSGTAANASVDSATGLVTAIKAGTSVITVKTDDGGKTGTATVTVQAPTLVTGVAIGGGNFNLANGSTRSLTATVTPANASNPTLEWTSSNTSVATVNSSGVVTAVANSGTSTITARSTDGSNRSATVTVTATAIKVTGISLSPNSFSLNVNATQTVTATVTPSNAADTSVNWTSGNSNTATVSNNGVVTGKATGTTTITATAADGSGVTSTANVTVTASGTFGPVTITETLGWLETLSVKWNKLSGATSYIVKYQGTGVSSYTQIDDALIREYGSYYRADILGLKAGTYTVQVIPVNSGGTQGTTATTSSITVTAHDRSGFAFSSSSPQGTASGAYNDDGTLKAGAQVLYLTAANAKTVELDVKESASKTTTGKGISAILALRGKGYDTTPLAVRIIGTIRQANIDSELNSLNLLDFKGKSKGSVANITVEGVGNDATCYGWGVHVRAYHNVEVRNLGFMMFTDDGVSLEVDNQNIWVHNNDIFYGADSGGDKNKGDGAMDSKTSGYVTMSYNHFWDSGKCNLLGNGTEDPEYLTYHHNWYDHSDSRHPRVRFHSAHVYNNYYDGNSKYGIGATRNSSVFAERNYFRNTKNPMLISMQGTDTKSGTDTAGGSFSKEDGGMIKAFDNYMEGLSSTSYIPWSSTNTVHFDAYPVTSKSTTVPTSVKTNQGSFTYNNFDTASSMYSYTSDTPSAARDKVIQYAGRMGGKQRADFSYDFNNSTDDAGSSRITALDTKIANYATQLVSIQGGGSSGGGGGGGNFVAVTGISGIPTSTTVGTLTLNGTVAPTNATNKTITWSKVSGTGTVSGNTLTTTASGTATIRATITNGASATTNYTQDFTITINASGGGGTGSVTYNFSEAPLNTLSTSAFSSEITEGGLILGSGSNLLAGNASTGGYSFTYCLRTGGSANATQRYIVVPLNGPATITVYATSNNSSTTTLNITSTVSSTTNIGTLSLPGQSATALGTPTYTSTTSGTHTVVLKSAASARIYMIQVDY